MHGHVEMRAVGLLLEAASGSNNLRSRLSFGPVVWLRDQGLVNDDGELTKPGRLLAHFVNAAVEFQLMPREALHGREGT